MNVKLILIGGFLGAGKTTVLLKMAEILSENGAKVGLITNDQASELVDSAYLTKSGKIISEVSGSCFCCNFEGFTDAVTGMYKSKNRVDYIIAEPVGSCTDLSATIMQPLKEKWKKKIDICPLNVIIDPVRLKAILEGKDSGLHKSADYIVEKQLEEADFIVINKMDLLNRVEINSLMVRTSRKWTQAKIYAISAQSGENMRKWMTDAFSSTRAGMHLAHVDYDIYAKGEASLGWLNASVWMRGYHKDWNDFAEDLLNNLAMRFEQESAATLHIKIMIQDNKNFIMGNITGTNHTVSMKGQLENAPAVFMTLNARVEIAPEVLKTIVLEELRNSCKDRIKYDIRVLKCFQPERPNPTHRYENVVV